MGKKKTLIWRKRRLVAVIYRSGEILETGEEDGGTVGLRKKQVTAQTGIDTAVLIQSS